MIIKKLYRCHPINADKIPVIDMREFLLFPSRSFRGEKMAVEKRLAFSIVQFLRDQTHGGALNSDEQESLEGGWATLAEGSRSLTPRRFFNHRKEYEWRRRERSRL